MAGLESFDVVCLSPLPSNSPSPTPPSSELDSALSGTSTPRRRHPDLWFSDGSIVFCAQAVLFRVHMTQLSRHSPVFRDMFSLPQPPGKQISIKKEERDGEFIEGCPVIELYDDPEDLAYMLTAIYDGPSFGNNDIADFRSVSGVLRLASKYVFEKLRDQALAHLHKAWPPTLEAWDAREERARAHEYETGLALYPSPIAVINLAREVHEPTLLPSAFYDLSRYTYAQIFECPACTFVSTPISTTSTSPLPAGPSRPHDCALSQTFSARDLQRLALGKEAAALAVTSVIAGVSRGPPPFFSHARKSSAQSNPNRPPSPLHTSCASPGTCRRDFVELASLATQHYVCERERGAADPLYVAEELGALQGVEVGECRACARALEGWARRERERLWRAVPAWFRIDGEMW